VKQAIILQHMDREGPGLIAELCIDRGLAVTILRLDRGDPVPAALTDHDLLVVMGGAMNVADADEPRYAFLAQEMALLRHVLARQQPVLGVCLGAQLLARAAGGAVYPNRRRDEDGSSRLVREVGFGPVRLLGRGVEPVLAGLPATIPVLHWHGETFDLPRGAVCLAESSACRHQAFRIGRRAFGLQFHVEVDAPTTRQWAADDAAFVRSALGPEGPATLVALSEAGAAEIRGPGQRLIRNILGEMLSRPP
jgi:GMP synthase-like glutamine amidotransferase